MTEAVEEAEGAAAVEEEATATKTKMRADHFGN